MKRLIFALLVIATSNAIGQTTLTAENNDIKAYAKSAGDGVTNYYAVICGISTYKYIDNLNYCGDDARDIRNALLASSNWTSSHITLLINGAATKSAIKSAIKRMVNRSDGDDVCLFFFSGHGGNGDDVYPYDELDGYDEYLCPFDSSPSTWNNDIRDDEFSDWIAGLRTSKYIIMLDTCFAGGQIKGKESAQGKGITKALNGIKVSDNTVVRKGNGFAANLVRAAGTKDLQDIGRGVVLAACQDNEDSWEEPLLQNGLFTYYLLQGMSGAGDTDYDKRISAEECFDYASPLVTNYASENYASDQHPQLYDALSEPLDFINFNPVVSKCTVTAGTKDNTDKISFSGKLTATSDDFYSTDTITITIDSDYMDPNILTFPIDGNTFKNNRYSYSGTENGIKKSFKYDIATHNFTFSAGDINLTGLGCPLTTDIQIGNYSGTAEVDEAIVNGKKPIPIILMMGVKNSLRVDKLSLKRGTTTPNSDQLSVKGGFSVLSVTDANMAREDFNVILDTQTFTIPTGNFKANKKGDRFTCSSYKLYDGLTLIAIVSADFNFKTCAFSLTIKNTDITADPGTAVFTLEFPSFGEGVDVVLP